MIKKIMESTNESEQEYYNRHFPKYKKYIKQIRDLLDSVEADYDDVESYLLSNRLNNSLLSDVDSAMSNLLDAWVRIDRCELSFDRLMNAAKKQSKKSFESKNTKRSGRKLKESNDFDEYEDTLNIDMWYGDSFNKEDYAVDCTFYPNDGEYRGNIYRLRDGKIVGDYSCSDSTVLEDRLGYDFD